MRDFFGNAWGEIRGVFGRLSGSVQLGGGEPPSARLSFDRDGSTFWLFVLLALLLGMLLGMRRG